MHSTKTSKRHPTLKKNTFIFLSPPPLPLCTNNRTLKNCTTPHLPPQGQYYEQTCAEIFHIFNTNPAVGLSDEEVEARKTHYGVNQLPEQPIPPYLRLLAEQFKDFMVLMLIVVSAFEFWLQEWLPGIVLFFIALTNAWIGFYEKYKAQKMLTGLDTLNVSHAHVLRNGEPTLIQARELVPGDVVLLEEGCRVPADIRLVETSNLCVMESVLLGESTSVEKSPDPVRGKHVGLTSVTNMAFMATAVTQGRGVGVVTATGRNTEVGKISKELFASKASKASSSQKQKPRQPNNNNNNNNNVTTVTTGNNRKDEENTAGGVELKTRKHKRRKKGGGATSNNNNNNNSSSSNSGSSSGSSGNRNINNIGMDQNGCEIRPGPMWSRTDFQKNVALLGKIIILGDICVCILVTGVMLLRYQLENSIDKGELYEAVVTGVSVGISGVPEGLVVVAAITMLIGLYRVQHGGSIVVKNSALVEALGSVTTICADKTGTLTEGKMRVEEVRVGGGGGDGNHSNSYAKFTFTGRVDTPVGQVIGPDGETLSDPRGYPEVLTRALMCCALCNNASILFSKRRERWVPTGTPTEVALMLATQQASMGKEHWTAQGWSFDREIPFSSTRRCMSVVYSRRRGGGSKPASYIGSFYCGTTTNNNNNNNNITNNITTNTNTNSTQDAESLTESSSTNTVSASNTASIPSFSLLSSSSSSSSSLLFSSSKMQVSSSSLSLPPHKETRAGNNYNNEREIVKKDTGDGGAEWAWEKVLLMKGAPEAVIAKCTKVLGVDGKFKRLRSKARKKIAREAEAMGAVGTRVLGLAYREMRAEEGSGSEAEEEEEEGEVDGALSKWEEGLTFLGLVGLVDPPREGVKEAIASCKAAGIRVCMITGDHPVTALAVARQLGIVEGDGQGAVREGAELDAFSAADIDMFAGLDPFPSVFARADSVHKLRILQALQHRNEVCIMTGDGVNDAPAIGHADIGIAMGSTAVDITKQAADVVLLDNNIGSIVLAVREGRIIYDNIKKFVFYLLTCNSAEVILILICGVIGLPVPITPTNVLWINIIVDVPPALSLGVDPPDRGIMHRPPRDPSRTFFDVRSVLTIAYQAFVQSVIALAIYWIFIVVEEPGALNIAYGRSSNYESASSSFISDANESLCHGRSLALCTITFLQLAHSFIARSLRLEPQSPCRPPNKALAFGVIFGAAFMVASIYVPGFNAFIDQHTITWFDWLKIAVGVFAYIAIITVTRYLVSKYQIFSVITESSENRSGGDATAAIGTGSRKRRYYYDF